jgi:hypothetical protein
MATEINDPWESIDPPTVTNQFGAIRVDPGLLWNFFWVLGTDKNRGLILSYDASSISEIDLPILQGIEVATLPPTKEDEPVTLLLKLLDSDQREIFYRLCIDLIEVTRDASTEGEAVSSVIGRAWKWHYLLRGGRDGKLTVEGQKGLIGELLVLERVLLANIAPADAVQCWTGPVGAPKDFEIGKIGLESKARRGMSSQFVTINSEFQLDETSVDTLYLCISDLNPTPTNTTGAFTVTDVCKRVGDTISSADPGAMIRFENLLSASGFSWADDYTGETFVEGTHRAYLISEGFPRIIPSSFQSGVSRVRYAVNLVDCEPFATTYEEIGKSVRSIGNAD